MLFFAGYKLNGRNEQKLSEYQDMADYSMSNGSENASTEYDWIVPDNYQSSDEDEGCTTASEADATKNTGIKQQNCTNVHAVDQSDAKASSKS